MSGLRRHLLRTLTVAVVFAAFTTGVDASVPPDGTGAPSEPAPAPLPPPSPPPPAESDPSDIFGACEDQGPLISGQVLARLLVAVPQGAQVVSLQVRSQGARIRELELPYHGWTVTIGEHGASADVDGEPGPVDHFWFWAAFIDVAADEIVVDVTAELLDGTTITHRGEAGDQPTIGELPALRIPVDRSRINATGTTGAAAGTTPKADREPCRIGDPPVRPGEQSTPPAGGGEQGGFPALVVGGAGVVLGIVGGWLLGRRRNPGR